MCPDPERTESEREFSFEDIKIPVDSSKGTPERDETVCALWVFQNCGGEKEKKLRRIVSLVRNRNTIDWLPVTTDGKVCIVTYLGEFNDLIKLRSSVFGLGMESYSFVPEGYWVTSPQDLSQFKGFFESAQSDIQSREKRLLQKREMEIKTSSVKFLPEELDETETIELTKTDIDDLRKELEAISAI